MPSEMFMRLYSYGTELYKDSKGDNPVPFEKMAEIDLLITTCRESASTDEEKSIVVRAQEFWDVCFRKWYDQVPEEFEKKPSETKKEIKALPPGPFEKVAMFAVLIRNIRKLKSGTGLADTTLEDFRQLLNLINQCSAISRSKQEKKVVKDAIATHKTQFRRWQDLQKEKDSRPQKKTVSEAEFDAQLSAIDKLILAAHHRIVVKKMGKDEK